MGGLPARLTAVTVGARDLPMLRRFYSGLGWAEVPGSGDNWASFVLGGVLFALYPLDDLAAEAAPDLAADGGTPDLAASAGGFAGVTMGCNVDSEDQVDRAFAAAIAAGATPIAEPTAREWGGRSAYFADPEGNRWEIAYAAGVQFDERGALISFG